MDESSDSEETAFGVGPDFGDSKYVESVHGGICAAAEKWNLTLSLPDGVTFGDFKYEGSGTKRLGNCSIAATTKANYEEQLKQLLSLIHI